MTRANFYIYKNGKLIESFSAISSNYPRRILPIINKNIDKGIKKLKSELKNYDNLTFNVCWEYAIDIEKKTIKYWRPILDWEKWIIKKGKKVVKIRSKT